METDLTLMNWLQKKERSDKYMSADIQNEILRQMALSVLCEIVQEFKDNQWFTIMGDEVTDCSNKEQLIICLRYVSGSLEPIETFIGLYQVDNIKSETLVNAIKDALTREYT